MRRVVPVAVLVVVVLLAVVYGLRSPDTTPPSHSSATTTPVVRLHRGSAPMRSHESPPAPRSTPPPRPAIPGPTPSAAAPDGEPDSARSLTLEDLDPDARQALGQAAMEHLHELADACESTLTDPEDLGAFVTLDHDGVVELELKPIGREAGPIAVEQRELPQALVDCLDDTLWSQDWSAAGPAVPEGSSLPLALTMRLDPASR